MVGTAMALALGKEEAFKNLKIGLIESSAQKGPYKLSPVHSNRVCALSEKTVGFFKSLGTFDFIDANRFGNVKFMHVWDACSDACISFRHENEAEDTNLAIIVENDLIQASLSEKINKFNNLKVIYSSQIKDFKVSDQAVDLKLSDNVNVKTKLLIGSDGVNSFIRQKGEFDVTKWDYDQIAIVSTLKLAQKAVNETAWQRFLPTGPIALLPLNEEYSSLVWSIRKSYAKELLEISDEEFVTRVNSAFIQEIDKNRIATAIESQIQNGFDLLRSLSPAIKDKIIERDSVISLLPPKVESCAPKTRASFPLSFMHSNNYVTNRIALVGDAVHRVHPLAGQGVNLGFGDVMSLVESLRESVKNGSDIGSSIYLKKYESKRQSEAYLKIIGIDVLNRLYTHSSYPDLIQTPLIALRSAGLAISNRVAPLKSFFVNKAMS